MVLFFGKVSPTTWSIGHAVPFHTRQIFDEFGLGLCLNTMQGREAKHQVVLKYCNNAMSSDRWNMVFRQEYVSLLWLPKNDTSTYRYTVTKHTWKPASLEDPTFCSCGRTKSDDANKCRRCESNKYSLVRKSVDDGKICDGVVPLSQRRRMI